MIRAAAVALVGLAAWGCAAPRAGPARPAFLNHVVLFGLQDPGDRAALVADCERLAREVPGVVSAFAGEHYDIGRAGVDADYDVGFYVGFGSEADYRAYLAHPAHVELVQRWRPRTRWIRVHDVADPTP